MIIAVTSQKGGSGKSTTATNLAAAISGRGMDVLLVSADSNECSDRWATRRSRDYAGLPPLKSAKASGNIASSLKEWAEQYQFIVVDCEGGESLEMRSALTVADIAVIPVLCSKPDLNTLELINGLVGDARQCENSRLKAHVLLSAVPTYSKVKDESEARAVVEKFDQLSLLASKTSKRRAYAVAMGSGLATTEVGNCKAANEINMILDELLQ